MTAEAAKVRKGRKFDQVVCGARDIFLRDGYEGASVDDIARAAGVSKATLYNYFPDKRLLFLEVATGQCQFQTDEVLGSVDLTRPPREVLPVAARSYMRFVLSPLGQSIFRVCVSETERFPEIGREFFECGPKLVHTYLVAYLQGAVTRGEAAIEDLDLAADQFAQLCKAGLWDKLAFGIKDSYDEAELDRVVDGAVDMFMARYGT
ncbi:TetR/AcrR family transcriptional regulator [Roseivivax sediminis]|uniref:DNA-binding transcriptional regulator, AcrR family n=1 Tax=Roseivivax sediminis TaxID=936889 RepID=A0A1I1UBN4_9RHOB|nr:TetR/AcrR family transcriptional regulator [Roseivivax sediminis]SFD65360.1 DNA-binding transcriptional regulator, AcrR family [Roseivivax sediminis]